MPPPPRAEKLRPGPAAAAAALLLLAALALSSGCAPRGYEFLKMPRAGLRPGSEWKPGLGPTTAGPAAGVEVAEAARGLDWLQSETGGRGGLELNGALAGFFAAGLKVDASRIVSVQAEGLSHRQVVDPEKLERGRAYLWETLEASKIRLVVDCSVQAGIQGRLDHLAASPLGRNLGLRFAAAGGSEGAYLVTGRNLVVAVKVAAFDLRARTGSMTLKLDRSSRETAQPGPFGYVVTVRSGGVDLPGRKVEVVLRNPAAADSDTGSWKRTLSGATVKVHSGPMIGERCDCVLDRAYVESWDNQKLACRVVFERTAWELRQIGCGLETVKP